LLGVCRLQAGDIEAALKAAHRAAEIRPDKPNFQALLAELYRQSGQDEVAAKHEERAKQLAGAHAKTP
jgi:cytochrome c-type biogenesis protein CcmH/NrfG